MYELRNWLPWVQPPVILASALAFAVSCARRATAPRWPPRAVAALWIVVPCLVNSTGSSSVSSCKRRWPGFSAAGWRLAAVGPAIQVVLLGAWFVVSAQTPWVISAHS